MSVDLVETVTDALDPGAEEREQLPEPPPELSSEEMQRISIPDAAASFLDAANGVPRSRAEKEARAAEAAELNVRHHARTAYASATAARERLLAAEKAIAETPQLTREEVQTMAITEAMGKKPPDEALAMKAHKRRLAAKELEDAVAQEEMARAQYHHRRMAHSEAALAFAKKAAELQAGNEAEAYRKQRAAELLEERTRPPPPPEAQRKAEEAKKKQEALEAAARKRQAELDAFAADYEAAKERAKAAEREADEWWKQHAAMFGRGR
jgi:hypothetical protein